jgi:putative sporulation protein YtaF
MNWLLIVGFAVSSSLDNLGVGITYGIRKIRIRFFSNLLIAAICFCFSYFGILFGKWISNILPGTLPIVLGSFILAVIGIRIIILAFPRHTEIKQTDDKKMKGIGSILQNPESVDFDKSKDIGIIESLLLGVALSVNALTNGLSAGLFGLQPIIISLTASIGSFLTILLGVSLGKRVANIRIGSFTLGQFGTLISGVILLVIVIKSFF